jgi:cytochrome c oxidase subunit IV|tara:strand:- start:3160 stop:3351 length:192 start_codon:yes stop_codon:yes gene_type:complete
MSEVIKWFFLECIDFLQILALYTNTTYEEINVIIFIILQPALVLLFFILWRIEKKKGEKLLDK